jgi:hypothetical protein
VLYCIPRHDLHRDVPKMRRSKEKRREEKRRVVCSGIGGRANGWGSRMSDEDLYVEMKCLKSTWNTRW